MKKQQKHPAENEAAEMVEQIHRAANRLQAQVKHALALQQMIGILFEGTPHRKTAETELAETKALIIEYMNSYDLLVAEHIALCEREGLHKHEWLPAHYIVLSAIKYQK